MGVQGLGILRRYAFALGFSDLIGRRLHKKGSGFGEAQDYTLVTPICGYPNPKSM